LKFAGWLGPRGFRTEGVLAHFVGGAALRAG